MLIPPATGNITSLYLALALFLSLYRTLAWEGLERARFFPKVLIVAVLAAATCSLKSTFIPACGIFLLCSFVFYGIRSRNKRTAIAEAMATALLEWETLDTDQVEDVMQGRPPRPPKPSSTPANPTFGPDAGPDATPSAKPA